VREPVKASKPDPVMAELNGMGPVCLRIAFRNFVGNGPKQIPRFHEVYSGMSSHVLGSLVLQIVKLPLKVFCLFLGPYETTTLMFSVTGPVP
jgi:hypothetical protein